ncbi:MAG TPA: formate dehydrogenase subunit gamma [Hyphomicrobiaceae bacterium]|nr:formate dehydrogenase subunit gamma [Hyphomicrobiaceae bacterium]
MSGSGRGDVHVRRYSGSARLNHWIMAISFVLLLLSGLSLFHPSLFFLSGIFGGGATVRWLHPWVGLVFAVTFLLLFVRFLPANLPERTDIAWLARLKHVLAGRDEYLPEVGKYNAGQKLVFWLQFILVPILLVTGFGLWEPGLKWAEATFSFKATMDQKRMAALLHAIAAVAAITIWIVHVYAAIWVRGTISAMTRGTVSGGWGWRHHRKWLKTEVSEGRVEKKSGTAPAE